MSRDVRPARRRVSVVVCPDVESLALSAATLVVVEARRAVSETGRFTLVLAGGSTPAPAYRLLAQPPFRDLMPWAVTHVFWGDERCVAPSDRRNNQRMARQTLLDHVPIPPDQVHPIHCAPPEAGLGGATDSQTFDAPASPAGASREAGPRAGAAARRAAGDYEALLQAFFGDAEAPDGRRQGPDLVLLGLGDDGHTASLFPGSEATRVRRRWTAAVRGPTSAGGARGAAGPDSPGLGGLGAVGPGAGLWRVTMTAPFVNRAKAVVFMATGTAKAAAVARTLEGQGKGGDLPARLIHPAEGQVTWMIDDSAATLLSRYRRR